MKVVAKTFHQARRYTTSNAGVALRKTTRGAVRIVVKIFQTNKRTIVSVWTALGKDFAMIVAKIFQTRRSITQNVTTVFGKAILGIVETVEKTYQIDHRTM